MLDATSAVLLRQLMDAGVVRLIATVRAGEAVGDAVDALCRGDAVLRVDLDVLDKQQVEDLLQTVLGGQIGRRTLQELYAASGGNLLYLHELVLGALAVGSLTSDSEVWRLAETALPGTARLTDLIQARLSTADAAGWAVLELLAACEPLSLADAEAAAGPQVLAGLEHQGLIHIGQDRRRSIVTLSHPLYGEALRADLPVLSRRAMLLQQAERTEACGARRREDLLHIASWRLAATGTADPALLTQAAFLARYAHDYAQVITLLEALPDRQQTTRTQLLHGEALYELGRIDEAEEFFADAYAETRTEEDRLAITMERTQSLFWGAARVQEALAVNDAARQATSHPAVREALTVNEGAMRVCAGQPWEGLALLESVEQNPDDRVRLYGLALKVAALSAIGRTREAVRLGEWAYQEHLRASVGTVIQHPTAQLNPLTTAYADSGELKLACETAERGLSGSMADQGVIVASQLLYSLGRSLWLAGRPATARRSFAEAVALAREHRLPLIVKLALSGLAACAALLGDIAAAKAALADSAAYTGVPFLAGEERLGEAWLLAAQGRLEQARAVLTEAAEQARTTGYVTSEAMLLTDLARLGGQEKQPAGLLGLPSSATVRSLLHAPTWQRLWRPTTLTGSSRRQANWKQSAPTCLPPKPQRLLRRPGTEPDMAVVPLPLPSEPRHARPVAMGPAPHCWPTLKPSPPSPHANARSLCLPPPAPPART
ncbi:helix-turn-helix transcriptional regulator [Streptomyces sp. NPDC015127]|uniref:helix-turn-helix transcriptional regulator n=1 Tax=Streptomyces sp. NPDC015127 TaxID=3364939 RepID=UPI0036FD9D8D